MNKIRLIFLYNKANRFINPSNFILKCRFTTNINFQNQNNEEKKKMHNEINKKLREFREKHKNDIKKPSLGQTYPLSEKQKHKEALEITILFQKLIKTTNENFDNFDEKEFVAILSKISRVDDNSFILKESFFEKFLIKTISKINIFKDYYNICLLINFCSLYNLNYPDIWMIFRNHILNNKDKLSIEAKCMILMSFSPINEECNISILNINLFKK